MKTFKNTLVAIASTVLLLAMIMVNVQVGLNDGTSSDITLLGTNITVFESAFAQEEDPGEEGDLGCEDLSLCDSSRSCGVPGMAFGCELDCEDDGIEPPGEEKDITCPDLE